MKNKISLFFLINCLLIFSPFQEKAEAQIAVFVPDSSASYNSVLQIPVRVGETGGNGILAVEFSLVFDSGIISSVSANTTGSMVQTGWLVAENTIPGTGGMDTLKVSMATAQNALTGSGDLIYLMVTVADVRYPASTPLNLTRFLFNDGTPQANTQNGTLHIMGTDGTVSADTDTVTVGQSLGIAVVDLDENRNDGLVETIQVLVFNTAATDSETVVLQETAVASGEFWGNINIVLGIGGTAYDGVLSVAPGDRIGIVYTDSLDASGNIQERLIYVDIAGHDGVLATTQDTVTVGRPIGITVVDFDENRDDGLIETIQVMVFAVAGTDSETVVLQETAVASGEFYGEIGTVYGVAGTAYDGVLSVAPGDRIGIVYTDSLDATGSISEIQLFVDIVGGTDGILKASRIVQALDGAGGRDTLKVFVADADLNTDISQIDTAFVKIQSLLTGETEWAKAVETDLNTGVFHARLPTVAGVSGIDNDGVMTLVSWDTLLISYTDSLRAIGDVKTLHDTIHVVNLFGDLSSSDTVEAFDATRILQISVGLDDASARDSLVGDVDGNMKIQAWDASLVLQYSVNLINRFPVQTRVASEIDPKNHPFLKPAHAHNFVELGTPQMQTDGSYVMPIVIEEREGVVSGMLRVNYEMDIHVIGIEMVAGYENFLTAYRTDTHGLQFAFAGSISRTKGSGNVAQIRFRSEPGQPFNFILKEVELNGKSVQYALGAADQMPAIYLPETVELFQNVPNPFNPSTSIGYALPEEHFVRLSIYNMIGQQIRTLVSQDQGPGIYFVVWNGKDERANSVSSGMYLLRLEAGGIVQTRKMLMVR